MTIRSQYHFNPGPVICNPCITTISPLHTIVLNNGPLRKEPRGLVTTAYRKSLGSSRSRVAPTTIQGPHFGIPSKAKTDHRIFGSILGPLSFGNSHMDLRRTARCAPCMVLSPLGLLSAVENAFCPAFPHARLNLADIDLAIGG